METQATETTETFDDPFEAFASEVVEADDQEIDTSEATESVDVSDDTDDEEAEAKSDDSEAEPEAEEQDQEDIETFEQLAEALDIPVKELMANLKFDALISGEHVPVTLEEAIKGYQRQSDYSRNYQAFKDEQQAHEAEINQTRQSLEDQTNVLGKILMDVQASIVGQEQSPEMQRLEAENPQQYLIAKMRLQEQTNQLNQYMQKASATYHENKQALEQKAQAERAERIKTEFTEKLPAAIQDKGLGKWDQDTNKAVTEYLQGQGYTAEEVQSVADHRDVVMAIKAMKYDEMQKSANAAKKKVSTVRKLQKKGGNKSVQPNRFQQARARMKKTGGDAASTEAAFEALFS